MPQKCPKSVCGGGGGGVCERLLPKASFGLGLGLCAWAWASLSISNRELLRVKYVLICLVGSVPELKMKKNRWSIEIIKLIFNKTNHE